MTERPAPWKPSLYVVIVVLAAFAAAIGTYWALQPRDAPRSSRENITRMDASALFDRYQENESAAHAFYGSARLIVTGTVEEVSEAEDEVSVDLRHSRKPQTAATAVLVKVSWRKALGLQPGAKVEVLCENATWLGSGPVLLRQCQLI